MPTSEGSRGLVLVIDDDELISSLVEAWLVEEGFAVERRATGEEGLDALSNSLPDAICLDLSLPGMSGLDVLGQIKAKHRFLPVIILTADTTLDMVVQAMRHGAYDYVTKPIESTKLVTTVKNAVERCRLEIRLAQLEREVSGRGYAGILGQSAPMKQLFRQMDRIAPTDITVLIHGESGTGKELVSRAIHENSGRRAGSFVALNCAAIPESLQESELFGHEKGAFTSAAYRRIGKFEEANGGTLFLDEVGELSPSLQAKLLRVVQERSFSRVGSSGEIRSDFRLIAATHRTLVEEVRQGRFREDLYFRIAVFKLEIPPLRDRKDDIPLLAERILADLSKKQGDRPVRIAPEALRELTAYSWPGNVRELENALQHGFVVAHEDMITVADLPARVREGALLARRATPGPVPLPREAEAGEVLEPEILDLETLERRAIEEALRRTNGNMSEVVRQLKIGRTTLYRKIKEYGLSVPVDTN